MKTKLLSIVLLALLPMCVLSGTDKVVLAPAVTPVPSLYGPGFEVALFMDGVWTQTQAANDRYFGTDHAFGGTIKGQYFFNKYFGGGLGFSGYDVHNTLGPDFGDSHRFVGSLMGLATARLPLDMLSPNGNSLGALAPYVSMGVGGMFNGGNKSLTEPTCSAGCVIKYEVAEHDARLALQPAVGVEYRFGKISVFTEGIFTDVTRPKSNTFGGRAGIGYSF